MKGLASKIVALIAVTGTALAPVSSFASHHHYRIHHHYGWRNYAATHRQQTKNTWRNAAYGAGALGAIGLLSHNGTLATLGIAGAAYSALRYEHDRRSQNRIQHHRR